MRSYQALHPTEQVPGPPDSVQTLLLAGGTAQAFDWPTSTGGAAADADAAEAHIVRFTGITTGGGTFNFHVALNSTHAELPSSGSSVTTGTTAGSTANSLPVISERTYQIPRWSTGWSAIARSSGYVIAEIWRM